MDIKLVVGQNIKKLRSYLGLTQEELANALNLTRSSVSNIEGGRQGVGLDNLQDIATALKVPIVLLFDGYTSKENIVEDVNVKLKILEIEHERLQKRYKKLIRNISRAITED